jgi:hypothetical protein
MDVRNGHYQRRGGADADFRYGSRLCENASEPRTLRIVFSIAYHQQRLPVRLVSTTTKSRWKFYTQVQLLSFHTAWVKSGPRCVLERWPLYPDEQTSASASIRSEKCQTRQCPPVNHYDVRLQGRSGRPRAKTTRSTPSHPAPHVALAMHYSHLQWVRDCLLPTAVLPRRRNSDFSLLMGLLNGGAVLFCDTRPGANGPVLG